MAIICESDFVHCQTTWPPWTHFDFQHEIGRSIAYACRTIVSGEHVPAADWKLLDHKAIKCATMRVTLAVANSKACWKISLHLSFVMKFML